MSSRTAPQSPANPRLVWVVIQIFSLSFHIPLAVMGGTQRALVAVGSALTVGLALSVASFLVYLGLWRMSKSAWKSLASTSVGILFFWHWNTSAGLGGLPPWVLAGGTFVLVLLAARRFAEHRYVRIGLFAVGVTFSSTFLMMFVIDELNTPPPVTTVSGGPTITELTSTPDIVFLVLDGYAREDVLRSVYRFDNSGFLNQLEASGFRTFSSANANYAGTHLSLPSMLNMTYVAHDGDIVSNSDLVLLAESISGDNLLVQTLKASGYTYVHGDTDHWLNSCGPAVDLCLPGPMLDVTADALLGGTPIGPLLYPTAGDPTTALNLTRINQLENWGETTNSFGPSPNFVFLHVILPHPPLYLDSECGLNVTSDLGGRNLNNGTISPKVLTERRRAYVEQTQCANRTVLEFLENVDRDTVIVITADHGPDSYGSMSGNPEEWNAEQIWERLATFSALRLPEGCRAPESENLQLVNTFRIVLGCLTPQQIPLLDASFYGATYGGPIFELKDPDSDVD